MAFKLVVKNGSTTYNFKKNRTKIVDRVEEFDNLAEALVEFLYLITDEYGDEKVSLSYKRPKNSKK